jgi:tRNA threonylcarbamoyladenosine biosynthesis protein TsaE
MRRHHTRQLSVSGSAGYDRVRPAQESATLGRMPTRSPQEVVLVSDDAEATRSIGGRLAAAAAAGDLVCLWGPLGAGKTQLAKGFGAGLGIADTINSPSFILMNEYQGRLPLFHVDLYRLAGPEEALGGGILDDRQTAGVTVLEWPERLAEALPARRLDVVIEGEGDAPRTLRIRPRGNGLDRYLAALA